MFVSDVTIVTSSSYSTYTVGCPVDRSYLQAWNLFLTDGQLSFLLVARTGRKVALYNRTYGFQQLEAAATISGIKQMNMQPWPECPCSQISTTWLPTSSKNTLAILIETITVQYDKVYYKLPRRLEVTRHIARRLSLRLEMARAKISTWSSHKFSWSKKSGFFCNMPKNPSCNADFTNVPEPLVFFFAAYCAIKLACITV